MLFLPVFVVFLLVSWSLNFSLELPNSLESMHKFCLKYTQHGSVIAYNLRQALICGERLPQTELKTVFMDSGLLHLLVISGAHLNTLELLISKIMFHFPRAKTWVTYLSFIMLNIFCQLQAPCLRAFFQKLIQDLNLKYKLFLSPIHEVTYAGLMCVSLLPVMTLSHSLILSWWISLVLKLPIKNKLNKCVVVYLSLIPWQISFMKLPIQSILLNWLIAPSLFIIMMPLALLETLFPFITEHSSHLWTFILELLKVTNSQSNHKGLQIPILLFWIYLSSLQIYLLRRSLWSTYQRLFTS